MAGAEDIIQNIVLAGQQDVIAGLDAIGAAGVKAFEAISSASSNLGSIGGTVAGFVGVTAAVAGVTAGIFALTDASAKSVVKIANFADEMGTTTGDMGTFITALNQAGNQTEDLTVSFRRVAVAVEASWPKVQKEVRQAADTIKEDYIKVGEAAIELSFQSQKAAETQVKDDLAIKQSKADLAKASLEVSRVDQNNAIAAIQAAQSVASADANVAAAAANADAARGNLSKEQQKQARIDAADAALEAAQTNAQIARIKQQQEAEDAIIRRRQALLDVQQKQAALAEAQRKQAEDAALAPFKQAEAELKLAKAREDQQEHEANSVGNLKKFVDDLAAGADTSASKVQLSTQNLVKGLIASVGPGISAIEGFAGSLGDVGARAPALFDVLKKVADVFHNTEDATLRAALATALFGRGYSFSLVAALEEGSGALEKAQQRLRDLGFEYTAFDEKVSRDFLKSLLGLEAELKILANQFGLTFAPSFTEILKVIQGAVETNRVAILQWAATIKDAALPVIAGFIRAIAGLDISKALQLNPEQIIQASGWAQTFDNIKQFIINFATGARDFIVNTLGPVFTSVQAGLQKIADGINGVFNTKLTGGDLGIGILVLAFSGLAQVIISVTFALGLLSAALLANPFGLVVIATAAAVFALFELKTLIEQNKQAIIDFVNIRVQGAFNWISDAFEDAITRIKRDIADLRQAFQEVFSFSGVQTLLDNKKAREDAQATADAIIAEQRRIRDEINAKSSSGSTATEDPNALTPAFNSPATDTKPIDEAKNKWFDLAGAVDNVTKKSVDDLSKIGKAGLVAATTTDDAFKKMGENIGRSAKVATNEAKDGLDKLRQAYQDAGILSFGQKTPIKGAFSSGAPTQQGGPQTTTIPKGQVLSDLTEINKALAETGQEIVRTFGGGGVKETKVPIENFDGIAQAADKSVQSVRTAGDGIVQVIGPGGKVISALQTLKEVKQPIQDAGNALGTFGEKAQALEGLGQDIGNPFAQSADTVKNAWQDLPDLFQQIFDQINGKADDFAQKLANTINAAKGAIDSAGSNNGGDFSSPANSPSAPGFADGGLFRGKGGIDTNLAWLTDKEFIINPKATDYWGEGFLHAINRMQNPFQGFSVGGLFRSMGSRFNAPMIPAFAGGGLNRSPTLSSSQQRALTLVLGGQSFAGLTGPSHVVDALEQHAIQDQLTSTGYQPRWKK